MRFEKVEQVADSALFTTVLEGLRQISPRQAMENRRSALSSSVAKTTYFWVSYRSLMQQPTEYEFRRELLKSQCKFHETIVIFNIQLAKAMRNPA